MSFLGASVGCSGCHVKSGACAPGKSESGTVTIASLEQVTNNGSSFWKVKTEGPLGGEFTFREEDYQRCIASPAYEAGSAVPTEYTSNGPCPPHRSVAGCYVD